MLTAMDTNSVACNACHQLVVAMRVAFRWTHDTQVVVWFCLTTRYLERSHSALVNCHIAHTPHHQGAGPTFCCQSAFRRASSSPQMPRHLVTTSDDIYTIEKHRTWFEQEAGEAECDGHNDRPVCKLVVKTMGCRQPARTRRAAPRRGRQPPQPLQRACTLQEGWQQGCGRRGGAGGGPWGAGSGSLPCHALGNGTAACWELHRVPSLTAWRGRYKTVVGLCR